ncbi:MAG: undecaprenyl-diphosphate phosphatase [Candidatus Moraniibacteriota bacterium]
MDFLHALILGIVEGVTEFLPISSTGHMILVSKLLNIPDTEFLKTFEVIIQMGAIFAVVALYWKKLLLDWEIMKRLVVALVPALGVGYLFYASIRKMLGSESVVLWSLLIGGIVIILVETFKKEKTEMSEDLATLPYKTVFLIGLSQALAVIPGVSRAGATIMGGLLLGMKRTSIVEFSFLLAVPTMVAATALDLLKNAHSFSSSDVSALLVGLIVSFVVAIGAIKFFLRFIGTHTFIPFGIYRIVVALLFFFFII